MKDLIDWLADVYSNSHASFAKRLSGSDTFANGAHALGPRVPVCLVSLLFPEWSGAREPDRRTRMSLTIDSHEVQRMILAVWHEDWPGSPGSDGRRGGAFLTGFGDITSPVLDPENTGALVAFAFRHDVASASMTCRSWVATTMEEEDQVEAMIGPVEPGRSVVQRFTKLAIHSP